MSRCDLKTYGECACSPGKCHQQPRDTTAPVAQPSLVLGLSGAIVGGAIVAFFVFVSMPRAMEDSHRQALDQQEASVQWK